MMANRDCLRLYKIQALPTQIFFDAEGREIGRRMGVIGERRFCGGSASMHQDRAERERGCFTGGNLRRSRR